MYTYTLTENGYDIYKDDVKIIRQYEPFIPYPDKTYSENAELQIHSIIVNDYVSQVIDKEITISDVPEAYRAEVKAILPNNDYGIPDELFNQIKSDYREQIAQEVSENGYNA